MHLFCFDGEARDDDLLEYLSDLSKYDWLLILVLVVVLRLLYKSLRIEWPENYFEPVRSLEFFVSNNLLSFLAFRILPTALVLVVFGAFSDYPRTVVLVSGLVYLTYSTLLTTKAILLDRESNVVSGKNRFQALAVTLLFVIVSIMIACGLVDQVTKYLPHPSEVFGNLIAGSIASILTLSYVALTRAQPLEWNVKSQVRAAVEEIETEIIGIALEHSVDPVLALSIAIVEDTQRPKWLRRIERGTHLLRRTGTYGLFQVRAPREISDLESCVKAMGPLEGIFPALIYGSAIAWQIERAAEIHNPDTKFAKFVAETYDAINVVPLIESNEIAFDGRCEIQVWQFVRFAEKMRLRGTAWKSQGAKLRVLQQDIAGEVVSVIEIQLPDQNGRVGWAINVDYGVRKVQFQLIQEGQESSGEQQGGQVEVDLGEIQALRDTTLGGGFNSGPFSAIEDMDGGALSSSSFEL